MSTIRCGMYALSALLLLFSCTSTVTVVPLSETAKKETVGKGIPYYVPAPCLLVTKNLPITTLKGTVSSEDAADKPPAGKAKASKNVGKNHYEFQIIYLPDLDRQYGIQMKGGSGALETSIALQNGWKLTGLNVKSDSQTDELIKATGDLLTSVFPSIETILKSYPPLAGIQKKAPEAEIWIYKLKKNDEWSLIFHWPDNKLQYQLE